MFFQVSFTILLDDLLLLSNIDQLLPIILNWMFKSKHSQSFEKRNRAVCLTSWIRLSSIEDKQNEKRNLSFCRIEKHMYSGVQKKLPLVFNKILYINMMDIESFFFVCNAQMREYTYIIVDCLSIFPVG